MSKMETKVQKADLNVKRGESRVRLMSPRAVNSTQGDCGDASRLDAAYARTTRVLVPIAMLVVVLCQLDSNNLAYAALTFNRDLGLSATVYGLASSMFFLTFSLFQIPSNVAMMHIGVRYWLGFLMIAWGAVASLLALTTNAGTFVALRMLLGACESGVQPALWFHLTQFLPQDRLTKPYAWMGVAILIACIIGAPIAAGFLAMDGLGGVRGWQWLFLLEGIPSVVAGVCIMLFLAEDLAHAKWLTSAQKELVKADMTNSRAASPPRDKIPRNPLKLLAMVLSNPLVPYMCLAGLLIGTGGYTIIFFLPIQINAVLTGRSLSQAKIAADPGAMHLLPIILTAVPYAVAAVAMWLLAHSSQHRAELFLHCGIAQALSGVCFIVTPFVADASVIGGFVCLIVLVSFYSAANGLTVAIVSRISKGPALVLGVPVYMTVATAGGMLGPSLTGALLQSTGGFTLSSVIIGVLLFVCGLMIVGLHWLEPLWLTRVAARGQQQRTSAANGSVDVATAAGAAHTAVDVGHRAGALDAELPDAEHGQRRGASNGA